MTFFENAKHFTLFLQFLTYCKTISDLSSSFFHFNSPEIIRLAKEKIERL